VRVSSSLLRQFILFDETGQVFETLLGKPNIVLPRGLNSADDGKFPRISASIFEEISPALTGD
jgi:hypothetical protein